MKMTRALRDFGFAVLIGSYLVLMSLFMLAYFNQDKILGIRINRYGEANIEFVMFLVSIPSVFHYLRHERDKRRASRVDLEDPNVSVKRQQGKEETGFAIS